VFTGDVVYKGKDVSATHVRGDLFPLTRALWNLKKYSREDGNHSGGKESPHKKISKKYHYDGDLFLLKGKEMNFTRAGMTGNKHVP